MPKRWTEVHLRAGGQVFTGIFSVKLGVMTVRIGRDSKRRRVGGMHQRVLARLLLHRFLRGTAGRQWQSPRRRPAA